MNTLKPYDEENDAGSCSSVPLPLISSLQHKAHQDARTVLEGGHYYQCKGPTTWSLIGWMLVQELQKPGQETMIFIDDVHGLKDLHPAEACLPGFKTLPKPEADITFLESDCVEPAFRTLEKLSSKDIPRKKRAKKKGEQWFCSGAAITDGKGFPLCVLLDLALSLQKQEMGFQRIINILPQFYEQQQTHLRKLMNKIVPELTHSAILYDLHGQHWEMGSQQPQPLTMSL